MDKMLRAALLMFFVALLIIVFAAARMDSQGALIPWTPMQFLNGSGDVVNGGKLCSYIEGSSTLQDTYTTPALAVKNTNPVILSSTGRPQTNGIYLSATLAGAGRYKFVLRTAGSDSTCSTGTVLWTADGIYDIAQLYSLSFATKLLDKVCMASQQTGSDFDAKVAACITALPSTGGVIWCFGLEGAQVVDANMLSSTKSFVLLLPAGTIAWSATNTITNPHVSVIGLGPYLTKINCTANSDCIRVTANPWTTDQAGTIGGFSMNGNSGGSATGIHVSGIIGLVMRDMTIENFTGGIGVWMDNGASWADPTGNFSEKTTVYAVFLQYNAVGLKFQVEAAATANSFLYSHFNDMRFNVQAGQVGLLVQGDGTSNGSPYLSGSDFHATFNCINAGTMWKILNDASMNANTYSVIGETTSGAVCTGLQMDANAVLGGTGNINLSAGGTTANIAAGASVVIEPSTFNPGTGFSNIIKAPSGIVLGATASGGKGITIWLSATTSVTVGNVLAQQCSPTSFSLPGALITDGYAISVSTFTSGIIPHVSGGSTSAPTIEFCNPTAFTIAAGTPLVTVDAWRHP